MAKPKAKTPRKAATAAKAAKVRTRRDGTKQARLIAMLERAKGANIAEMSDAFGWQGHAVRGALAGALKKNLRLKIVLEKSDQRGRVYRIEA